MKKVNVLWIILDLIFLIVFNTMFCVIGGAEYNATVWISYGFIHFSYLMLLLTPLFIRKGGNAVVLGMPLYSISKWYFFVELIVGVIFILIASDSSKAALLTQIVIASIYVICLISYLIANEYTADSIKKHEIELKYVKESAAALNLIIQNINDKALKRKVEKAYDLIHSSPIESNHQVRQIELDVIDETEELSGAVNRQDTDKISTLADSICRLADERNRQVQLQN